jgi:hypothetical protein
MLSLRQIRHQVEKRAPLIGAEHDDLPTYGSSRDFGYPHIEVDESHYHWVVVERGQELERRTYTELDDLLFTVFASATHSIASRWELAHRASNQDSRRLLFQRQIELLTRLDPAWAARQREHLDAVLRKHPFQDAGPSHQAGRPTRACS